MVPMAPKTPSGVVELLPAQQLAFQRLLYRIRLTFEHFGFMAVETPVFEYLDTLKAKAGSGAEHQMYYVQSSGDFGRQHPFELGLRFDQTLPLARYVAQHESDLSFPFRCYQIGRVYRGERPQKGRFREFYQCDIDVIDRGFPVVLYEAELLAVVSTLLAELGVGDFTIKISNRKLLLGILWWCGITESSKACAVLREIDKLGRISSEALSERLGEFDLLPQGKPMLEEFLAVGESEIPSRLAREKERMVQLAPDGEGTAAFARGLAELFELHLALSDFGVSHCFTPSLARGLDYYTGNVYEIFLDDQPGLGSVCSGGRYDGLGCHYGFDYAGVGLSIGATRLWSWLSGRPDWLERQHALCGLRVMIACLDTALVGHYHKLAGRLRAAGIKTTMYLNSDKLAKQLRYADRIGIDVVILLGEDELKQKVVGVKFLASGQQRNVPDKTEELIQVLKQSRSLQQEVP